MRLSLIAPLLLVLSLPALAVENDADRSSQVPRLRTELAAGYYARGQYGVALQEVDKALAADSSYAPAYYVQGLVYMDLQEFDTADKSFRRAVSLDPTEPNANHNYGWFLCNKRKAYKESIPYFLAALKNPLYNTPEKSQQQAGLCALKAGDTAAAAIYLRQADRAQPDNPQTLYGLALLSYQRGDFEAARNMLSRQARLGQGGAEELWLNLRVENKLGNTDNVAGFGKELKTRFPDSEEARLLAAGQYD